MFDKRLFSLVPECKAYVAGIVLLRWLSLLANIGLLYVISLFVGLGVTGVALSAPKYLELTQYALGLVVIRSVFLYLAQRVADALAHRAKAKIRMTVYNKLLDLGPAYAEQISTSEALQTSVEGATQLEVYFGGYLPQFMYAFLAPLTLFIVLVPFVGWPAVILMLLVPLIPVSIVFIQKPARKAAKRYWANYVDLGGSFLEAVQGLTTLKIFQVDERWHQKMNREAESFRKATMSMLSVQLSSIAIMDLFAYAGAAVGIIVALVMYAAGDLSFTGCFLVIFLSQEFFLPLRLLGSLFHAGMGGLAASRRMYQILETENPAQGTNAIDVSRLQTLTLENVSYSYGERRVLKDVNLTFEHPGFYALVGESGCGKSTLAGIIAGRKLHYQGKLTLGDVDVKEIQSSLLMKYITLVGTDAHLFEGTIRENLALANPHATDNDMWQALTKARLASFVKHNGGLDFKLKESATNISGGQAQRLALARALMRDAQVYIFDEATSSIDPYSEQQICAVMKELAKTKLVIVIAHRIATIQDADKILAMSMGRVLEQGTHEELIIHEGSYKQMWDTQTSLAQYATTTFNEEDVDHEASLEASKQKITEAELQKVPSVCVLARLFTLVKPLYGYLFLAVLLGVVGHMAAIAIPALGAYGLMTVGKFLSSEIGFVFLLICIVVSGVLRGPARYGEQLLNHFIAFKLLAHIRDLIFTALRRLAPAKLEGRGKGDVVSLATSDVELLEVFYAHTISPIAIATVVCAIVTVAIGFVSLPLALYALAGYILITVVMPLALSVGLARLGMNARQKNAAVNSFVLDQLRGISEVIQFGVEPEAADTLEEKTSAINRTDTLLKRRNALNEALSTLVITVLCIGMLLYSYTMVASGVLSFGAAFMCTFVYFSSFGPAIAVCRLGTSLQQTIGSGRRVLALLDEEPQVEEVIGGKSVNFDGIKGHDFSFTYENEKVFEHANFTIQTGKIYGIVGKSGSGKSTLLKLMMRFWDVKQGSIDIANTNVKDVTTSNLRSLEGYMTQSTYLFGGTLKDNITLVKPDASKAQIIGALRSASLEDFVASLPDGLDTKVADLGSSLSGGERQRIGLARMFLYGSPLILLDEPTSNLDALNEAEVMKAIRESKAGHTIVVVSHRPSTVAFADEIYQVAEHKVSVYRRD